MINLNSTSIETGRVIHIWHPQSGVLIGAFLFTKSQEKEMTELSEWADDKGFFANMIPVCQPMTVKQLNKVLTEEVEKSDGEI